MVKVLESQYVGCLLGGAVGDALGAPIEFMKLYQIKDRFGSLGIRGYVEFDNEEGEFTDDTQMTLFTAEALLRAYHRAALRGIEGALPQIAHESYMRWLDTQMKAGPSNIREDDGWLINETVLYKRRAPGNTCLSSLMSGEAGEIDMPINNSKGCGTIMRMAPVGLLYFGENSKSFEIACQLSAITHGHPTGYLSAGVFASIIADLSIGLGLKESINNSIVILKKWEHNEETLNAIKAALLLYDKSVSDSLEIRPQLLEALGEGWIAEEALAMSLFTSLLFENDYEKGVLYGVNHSGDCDSTGSIVGNILGLINGVEKIPETWVQNLRYGNIVRQIGMDLYVKIKGDGYEYDREWMRKYPGG